MLQILAKSVHFRRSYFRTREHHQRALESESKVRLKPSFEQSNNVVARGFVVEAERLINQNGVQALQQNRQTLEQELLLGASPALRT